MRRIITLLVMSMTFLMAEAGNRCEWKEKMMSEKIAFLTIEMNLTPEEAQIFWPVYNQVNSERDKAMHEVFREFRAMDEAVKSGKSEKEIEKIIDAYLLALDRQKSIDKTADEKFRKVLSIEKVAKLYVGEEKFRRQHIRKLNGNREKRNEGTKPKPAVQANK